MFRRRSTGTSEVLDTDEASSATDSAEARTRSSVTAPKGAPTPKRSEAQANRRQPYQAPADRKTAAKQSRARERVDRGKRTAAYQRGESWALPRKDQGPVRALARDVVDARRGLGEYYMIILFVFLAVIFLPGNVKLYGEAVVLVLLAIAAVEGQFVAARARRLARDRYPAESTKGLGWYVTSRNIALRRMRMPKPRVRPGDQV